MTDSPKIVSIDEGKAKKGKLDDWRFNLILSERDRSAKACEFNAAEALRKAPAWKGVIAFDDFSKAVMCMARPPWVPVDKGGEWEPRHWTDVDDIRTAEWLQQNGIMVPTQLAAKGVQSAASDQTFHPVRDYLESIRWDGTYRLETWLTDYLGVEQTLYSEAVGLRWMISAVARIFQPGCKADSALVLKGPQNLGKSQVFKILGGYWSRDRIANLGSKEALVDVQGSWIFEFAELDVLKGAAMSTVKAFMSGDVDWFRMPYGHRTAPFPRQCVFAGTVNPEGGILEDPTGGRRWWPVDCTKVELAALERDRDQLWAEAVWFYDQGSAWYLDTEELKEAALAVQAEEYVGDLWDDPVADYLSRNRAVTVPELLERAINKPREKQNQRDMERMVKILISMGWHKVRLGKDHTGKRPWGYVKKD